MDIPTLGLALAVLYYIGAITLIGAIARVLEVFDLASSDNAFAVAVPLAIMWPVTLPIAAVVTATTMIIVMSWRAVGGNK